MDAAFIVDVHMHLYARFGGSWKSRHYGKVRREDGSLHQAMIPSFVNTDSQPEVALGYMDWCGVKQAILLQGGLHGVQNEFYQDVVAHWPDRFAAMAQVDPTRGAEAARDLKYFLDNGHLGVKFEMDELRKLRPGVSFAGQQEMKVFEVCAEKNAPIFVHLSSNEHSLREGEDILQLLARWPHLNFVVCHIGVPPFEYWRERALLAQHPNIYLDTAAFYWYYHDEQTYPYPAALENLQWVVEKVGAAKLLWGSDYPMALTLTTYKQMIDLIRVESAFLSEDEKQLILGVNARQLLMTWTTNRR